MQLMVCKLKLLECSLSLHAVEVVLVKAAVTVAAED